MAPKNSVSRSEKAGNFARNWKCFVRQRFSKKLFRYFFDNPVDRKVSPLPCIVTQILNLSHGSFCPCGPPFPPKSCGFPDAETAAKIPAWAMPDDGASGGQAVGVAVGTLPKKPFRCVFDSFGNGALSGPACFDVGQRGAAPLRQTVPGPESTPSLSIKAHTV